MGVPGGGSWIRQPAPDFRRRLIGPPPPSEGRQTIDFRVVTVPKATTITAATAFAAVDRPLTGAAPPVTRQARPSSPLRQVPPQR
ncbi:hypothetical protein JCM4914_03960 [Streptomyces platensis subsp. malvinus]